jgi:hypothetical protein
VRATAALIVSLALASLTAAAIATAAQPEVRIRHRLEIGVGRTATAKRLIVRTVAEIRKVAPHGGLVPLLRLESREEKGGTLKTDDRRYPAGRWTRRPINQVITVGERVWWRAQSETYRQGTIKPSFAKSADKELTELERALANTRHLRQTGDDTYELSAPATTFDGPEARDYPPIRLVVTLDTDGRLQRLRRVEDQGGVEFVATETFSHLGRPLGIAAPPAASISPAPIKHITTSEEFSELFGRNLFGD